MKILVEGQSYNISELQLLLNSSQFYRTDGDVGYINHVGYCHSLDSKEVVYFLPKVFLIDGKLFGEYIVQDNIPFSAENIPELNNNSWIGKLLLLFFRGIVEFKRRNPHSNIVDSGKYFELSSNLGINEYSYLDICLSILDYFKHEKEKILFRNAKRKSSYARKLNWRKTVSKHDPIIVGNQPIYPVLETRKRQVDNEEQLLIIFYSILNHISNELGIRISLAINYDLYTGSKFKWLESNGLRVLKKIKYKYFSDDLKKIYNLCHLYLDKFYSGNVNRKKDEFIAVRDYNIVFEDMIDKLFTDESLLKHSNKNISIKDLKNNRDGKIIDHLFKFDSIIDDKSILYIGDSKYYKPDSKAGDLSIYKQYTYAKNVIQFNIDLLNNPKSERIKGTWYRDEVTDGYNITPNFMLYAFLPYDGEMILDFTNHWIKDNSVDGKPEKSFHFEERLFDRDTLFIHEYRINFLFVLHSYCITSTSSINAFRLEVKNYFKSKMVKYLQSNDSNFEFKTMTFENQELLTEFVKEHFKELVGTIISLDDKTLLLAVNKKYASDRDEFNQLANLFTSEFDWNHLNNSSK